MYNPTSTSASAQLDSKYSVADILTSMANGEPITPSFGEGLPFVTTSVPTGTTPVLTPSTIHSIEQTFNNLQQNSALDFSRQRSGFIPPVIEPSSNNMVKQEYDYDDDSSQDPDWDPIPTKKQKVINISPQGNSVSSTTQQTKSTPGRKRKYQNLSPEEEEKRRLRRERNKMAAAKCRQRRVDLTNELLKETEGLEEEQAKIENEIQKLQQQKDQLEFLLEAHKHTCQAKKLSKGKNDAFAKPTRAAANAMPRPTSLPIQQKLKGVTEATGIAITTPSNGVFGNLGLDSMVDGHTGLTPITGAPTCASEVQRTTTSSESSSEGVSSPTLMAL